jgi:hypothetical protein
LARPLDWTKALLFGLDVPVVVLGWDDEFGIAIGVDDHDSED